MSPKHKLTLARAAKLMRTQAMLIEQSYATPSDHRWDDADPETFREHCRHDDLMQCATELDTMRTGQPKPA